MDIAEIEVFLKLAEELHFARRLAPGHGTV
jgi:hypothetical protein